MPVTALYSPAYTAYDLGPGHPFAPYRAEMVLDLLAACGVALPVEAPPAASWQLIEAVHDGEYVAAVRAVSATGRPPEGERFGLGTPDNPVVTGMAEAAAAVVGGSWEGARRITAGEATRVLQLGGGLHHARRRLASGFCLFNDLVVAIRWLVDQGLHVMYLDLDAHHGDGVQELLESDEHVLTLSVHETGEYLFPGTGWIHELGRGMGRARKLNLPLEPFTEGGSFLEVLGWVAEAAADHLQPDVLVVQAGADAHADDPLADLMLTTQDLEAAYRLALGLADRYCDGRVLVTLGGGYAPDPTARAWALLAALMLDVELPATVPPEWIGRWRERLGDAPSTTFHDPPDAIGEIPRRDEIERQNRLNAQRLLDAVAPYWWF
jgi:acetoin utilization protein AcuC